MGCHRPLADQLAIEPVATAPQLASSHHAIC